VGLVAAFCLMKSCAGRFGALTGFGLSLVKWVAIAKVCSVILSTHYRSSHGWLIVLQHSDTVV